VLLSVAAAVWQLAGISWHRRQQAPEPEEPGTALGVAALQGAAAQRQLGVGPSATASRELAACPVGFTCCSDDEEEEMQLLMSATGHLTKVNCPSGALCIKEGKRWMLIFYICGICFLFIALAIVCEEFFVPSLERFVDEYNISMDVAGATFMAAGGSMPELFTSFIGTFQESDIGMAAIVGSAVFNVLFVIAACAVASEKVLHLTWWPLARDCSCYLFSLATLAVFFKGSSPGKIEAWEAAILLVEYMGYCTLMKFNQQIFRCMKRNKRKVHGMTPAVPQDPSDGDLTERAVGVHRNSLSSELGANFVKPSTFRASIVALLVQNESITDTVGIATVTKTADDLRSMFDRIDTDGNGAIDEAEFKSLMTMLGLKPDSDNLESALKSISKLSPGGCFTFDAFKRWFLASEVRIEIKMTRVFERFDRDHSGTIDTEEVTAVLRSLGHQPSEEDGALAIEEIRAAARAANEAQVLVSDLVAASDDGSCVAMEADKWSMNCRGAKSGEASGHVTLAEFSAWYRQSLFYAEKRKQYQNEEHLAQTRFTLDPPHGHGWSTWLWYIVTYPVCAAMYVTMPDVRNPGSDHVLFALVEFFLSLVWIGIFALGLVEWTEITSNTLGFPVPVAAVTVLAAGTSIPDLLSSYIVAKQGQGDMAVSSSIGSNIFDVTVGLPLPWLVFNISKGPVIVRTNSLGVSIIVLIIMLAFVIGTIVLMRWRMTKCMGYIMFALYVLFLIQALLQTMPEGNPIWPPPF